MAKYVHVGYQGDNTEMEKMVDEFSREIKKVGKTWLMREKPWEIESPEDLLKLRTELWHKIKAGMVEKKNLEAEIAFLAASIWWGRMIYEEMQQREEYERDDLNAGGDEKDLKEEREAWDKVGNTGETEQK